MASKGVVIVVSGEDKSGEVFAAINKHLEETKDKAKETNESLGEMGEVLKRGLETAGIAVGLREVISQFKEMISSSMEMGVQLAHLSQQTGISVQNLSVLRYAAQASGVDFDLLTRGFKKLAVNVYEADNGNKAAAKGFTMLGISAAQLKAKGDDMYGIFALLADKFQAMPDGITKSDAAAKIFGARMGSELIPVLNQGAAAIEGFKSQAESLGLILDEAGTKKLEEMHQASVKLHGSLSGLGLEITSTLSPALVELSNTLTEMVQSIAKDGIATASVHFLLDPHYRDYLDKTSNRKKSFSDMSYSEQLESVGIHSAPSKPVGTDTDAEATRAEAAAKKLAEAQERADNMRRQLSESAAKVRTAQAKAESDTQLAVLESMHKLGLVSESTYLNQKAALQNAAFQAEKRGIAEQRGAIMQQYASEAVKKPKGATGRIDQQTKLNDLKKQENDLDAKSIDLQARQAEKARELETARDEALKKQKAQIAEMEADLERLTGFSSTKAVAAQRQKAGEQRQGLANGGASPQQLAEFDALEKLREAKLEVEALDRRGEQISQSAALAEAQVEQAQLGHAMSAAKAEEALQAIHANEIKQLKELAAAYAQYGQVGMESEAKIQREITQSMQAIKKETDTTFISLGEGLAHSLFDPLFNVTEKWSKRWKQMRDGLLRDLGQFGEKQLTSALFGDNATGKSGGGILGQAGGGRKGLAGEGTGILGDVLGLFHKNAGVASNGGLGLGAGTIPSAAAATAQMGLLGGGAGTGGIQVILNNQGPPMQVDQTQQSGGDGGEGSVIQIMLKQLQTNGPVAQGIMGLLAL